MTPLRCRSCPETEPPPCGLARNDDCDRQPAVFTGILTGADDRTVQINITWIYGSTEQLALRYAWRDYPNMPLTSGSPYDLPAPPFQISLQQ